MTDRSVACGLCGDPASDAEIQFAYPVPENQRRKYGQADTLRLDLSLCGDCAPKVLKHLKRIFGVRRFQPANAAQHV